MTKTNTNPTSYYTPGNPKRKRKITREWFEKILCKAFTDTDIIEKIRNLPDKELVRLYLDYLPKETKVDSSTSVTLVIQGLEKKVIPIDQIHEHRALPENIDD